MLLSLYKSLLAILVLTVAIYSIVDWGHLTCAVLYGNDNVNDFYYYKFLGSVD